MVDPHLMLLLMQLLGEEYTVWDRSAEIEFVRASRKSVTSIISISDESLELIKRNTASGEKYLAKFIVKIRDEDDGLVARVKKTVYVRKKELL